MQKNEGEYKEILDFCELVQYQSGIIVSKTIIDDENGRVSLFAFAKGEKVSPHQSPYDALVQVLEGEAEILIGDQSFVVKAGKAIVLPANIMHSITAHQNFKMLLTLIKSSV